MSSKVAVFQGGLFLFLQQLLSRGLTFIASQVLLRFLTAEKLGLATQLEVYYLSILFFAQESLRVAVQRQPVASSSAANDKDVSSKAKEETHQRSLSQTAINLGYLAVPLGFIVSVIFGNLFLRVSTTTSHVPLATKLYALAALIELAAEPFFALLAARQHFGARAAAESSGAIARCLGTLGTAYWAAQNGVDLGVLPFAAGQLAYGGVLWGVYVLRVWPLASKEGFSLLPRGGLEEEGQKEKGQEGGYVAGLFYRPTMRLAASMQAQGLVKHFLTQGDTLIVSVLASTTAQGVYALANNYGGLVARLVFRPVEEMSRNYFGRLLAQDKIDSEKKNKDADVDNRKKAVSKAATDLSTVLQIYILFSTIVMAVGPIAAPSVIQILAGTRWAADGAGTVLAHYCYYIPLLALNGLTEAFVASVATETQVHSQSLWMAAFSGIFGAAGYFFLAVMDLQASGLVFANIVNMGCRIVWSSVFISKFFEKEGVPFDILGLKPGLVASVACVGAPEMIRRAVEMVLPDGGNEFVVLAVTGVAAVPVVISIALAELPFLKHLYKSFRSR